VSSTPLSEIRDRAVNAFQEWLQHHEHLFRDSDRRRNERRQREFNKLMKEAEQARTNTTVSHVLGFALWAQNYLTIFGVNFGIGIVGEHVKSLYITNDEVDRDCSERLAHTLADVLLLQFIDPS